MRVLITGITGFAGSHLADFLLKRHGVKIYGFSLSMAKSEIGNIEHIKNKLKLYECDILNAALLRKIIAKVNPDVIFHLAAQAFIPESWISPAKSLITNIIGELNLLEAVRELGIKTKIHIAGSALEYGKVHKSEIPVKETNPLRPLSPYAVGKVGQGMLGYQYSQSYGMFIVRTRAFNHCGARMNEKFVASNFSKQIAMIEKNKQDPVISVGNLNSVIDFVDVRDVAEAYWLSVTRGESGEVYNICSGKGYQIKEVLEILLRHTKMKIKIKQDKLKLRPADVQVLIGDNSKFYKQTGWKSKIHFEDTLKDVLAYWRGRI